MGLCSPECSVRCACECFATIWLLTVGRECNSGHGVHTGFSDVFEVHGDIPEKGTKHCEHTWRRVKQRPARPQNKTSKDCLCHLKNACYWRGKHSGDNQAGSPLQLQYVNNSESFWGCTADCTASQLFINPFFTPSPCLPVLSCSAVTLCFVRDLLGYLAVSGLQRIIQIYSAVPELLFNCIWIWKPTPN